MCVVCCKEETLGKRECVVYEEGESEREGEGEAHEEEAEDGRERERARTSGVYLGSHMCAEHDKLLSIQQRRGIQF